MIIYFLLDIFFATKARRTQSSHEVIFGGILLLFLIINLIFLQNYQWSLKSCGRKKQFADMIQVIPIIDFNQLE